MTAIVRTFEIAILAVFICSKRPSRADLQGRHLGRFRRTQVSSATRNAPKAHRTSGMAGLEGLDGPLNPLLSPAVLFKPLP